MTVYPSATSVRRSEIGVAIIFVALVVPTVAFVLPWRARAVEDAEATPVALRCMKDEACHWSSIPPLRLQVTMVDVAAATAELPNGVVTWRTLFGVVFGSTPIDENQSKTRWRWNRLLLVIAAVLILELPLLAGGVWLIWPARRVNRGAAPPSLPASPAPSAAKSRRRARFALNPYPEAKA